MSTAEQSTSNKIYYKIIDGTLRRTVDKDTEGAVKREWQAGGESGVTYELVYDNLKGYITRVSFYEGDMDGRKFTTLNIELDPDEDGMIPVIGTGIKTKYAKDLMHKLPNVDTKKEVCIRPFAFIPEGGDREMTGVSVLQKDSDGKFQEKIQSYFFDKSVDPMRVVNGFPEREKPYEEQSDEEREVHKIKVLGFLKNYTIENVAPRFSSDVIPDSQVETIGEDSIEYPEEEIDPKDIPF